MITIKSCPNCGSSNFSQYQLVASGGLVVEIIPGVKVDGVIATRYCRCQGCSLIFQNPRLSDEELEKYYSTGYYRQTINQPPEGMVKSEENRAVTDSEIIRRYIGKVKTHLDIGCGLGYLLEKVGADIKVGIESDVNYVKIRGTKVYRELREVSPKRFDLITLIHSLEHLPYPLKYLRGMTRFLKDGGHLVVEVPSAKTRGGPLGFAHLHYFEPDVLRFICREVGLEVVKTEFTPHLMLICRKSPN